MGDRIIVVGRGQTMKRMIQATMARTGFELVHLASVNDALASCQEVKPALVIGDIGPLGIAPGSQLNAFTTELRASAVSVLLLGSRNADLVSRSDVAKLSKPFLSQALLNAVLELTGHPVEESQLYPLNGQDVYHRAEGVANSETSLPPGDVMTIGTGDLEPIPMETTKVERDEPREPPPVPPPPRQKEARSRAQVRAAVTRVPPLLSSRVPPPEMQSAGITSTVALHTTDVLSAVDLNSTQSIDQSDIVSAIELANNQNIPIDEALRTIAGQVLQLPDIVKAETDKAVESHTGVQANLDAVTSITREIVEKVVWEVVPPLAEALIKEEITRWLKAQHGDARSHDVSAAPSKVPTE